MEDELQMSVPKSRHNRFLQKTEVILDKVKVTNTLTPKYSRDVCLRATQLIIKKGDVQFK